MMPQTVEKGRDRKFNKNFLAVFSSKATLMSSC